ncbi:MAG: twin-arginine translocase subunit TatC, partial [Planctomycetota bacterium]
MHRSADLRYVMTFMQSPLTRALENYYLDKAVDDLQTRYGEKEVTEELKTFVRTNRLVFDDVVVEAAEVERLAVALQRVRSQAAAGANTSDTQPPPAQATAADHAASDPADADKSATKTAAAEKPAIEKTAIEKTAAEKPVTEKNSDEPATAAETPQVGTVAAARQFIVDDEKIPMPSSNFVRSRIWKPVKMDVRSLNAQEAFMIWMKAGLLSGIVVASPFIFWQIWQFI